MPGHCCDDIDLLGDLDCVIGLAFATISTPCVSASGGAASNDDLGAVRRVRLRATAAPDAVCVHCSEQRRCVMRRACYPGCPGGTTVASRTRAGIAGLNMAC